MASSIQGVARAAHARGYALAIFLSGFLLFLVQPLLAKSILPWFGGVPGVWATALVFYQALLLAGYAYAHWLSARRPARQGLIHGFALIASLLWLPVVPSLALFPFLTLAPGIRVAALLTITVAGPYLMLSASSPLLQSWHDRRLRDRSTYRLYAVSNAGSLAGLLAYPFLVEPLMDTHTQAWLWSALYVVFACIVGALAFAAARAPHGAASSGAVRDDGMDDDAIAYRPYRGARLAWFAYPLCGAGLLVAVTNSICLDVATIPFLWVLPLAVYLVSYILAFAGWYHRYTFGTALFISIGLMAAIVTRGPGTPAVFQISVSLLTLFAACMVCHGELARRAPPGRFLTGFYLVTAAGGVTGGALVAVVAPAVLRDFYELPIFLLLAVALFAATLYYDVESRMAGGRRPMRWAGLGAIFVLAAIAFITPGVLRGAGTVTTMRNFYGVLRVIDDPHAKPAAERKLMHGGILHGVQFLDAKMRGNATSYYAPGSGIALAFEDHPLRRAGSPLHVGVIGLGAGAIAALAQPQDSLRFYEINPDVEVLARRYFTFLQMVPTTVVLGDGRLSLEQEVRTGHTHAYDILVIDAFSGDAIPVHLLTLEAMRIYREVLRTDGVIAINGTNRHLDIAPVVRGLATVGGMRVVRVVHDADAKTGATPSVWYLLTAKQEFIDSIRSAPGATIAPDNARSILWTDAFSNPLRILR